MSVNHLWRDGKFFGKQFNGLRIVLYGGIRGRQGVAERAERLSAGDFYRERAQDCLKQADQATTDQAKTEFLRLAEHWHRLAQKIETSNW